MSQTEFNVGGISIVDKWVLYLNQTSDPILSSHWLEGHEFGE